MELKLCVYGLERWALKRSGAFRSMLISCWRGVLKRYDPNASADAFMLTIGALKRAASDKRVSSLSFFAEYESTPIATLVPWAPAGPGRPSAVKRMNS